MKNAERFGQGKEGKRESGNARASANRFGRGRCVPRVNVQKLSVSNLHRRTMEMLGDTLLDAAISGDLAAVKDLLSKGANVNYPDEELGDRPLHRAAMERQLKVAKYLIEQGADVNAACNLGSRPLHWAAESGDTEMLQLLIGKGAQVDATDSDNRTAADWAASAEFPEAVKMLKRLESIKRRDVQRFR